MFEFYLATAVTSVIARTWKELLTHQLCFMHQSITATFAHNVIVVPKGKTTKSDISQITDVWDIDIHAVHIEIKAVTSWKTWPIMPWKKNSFTRIGGTGFGHTKIAVSDSGSCIFVACAMPSSSKNRRNVNSKNACFPPSYDSSLSSESLEELRLSLSGSTGSKLEVSVGWRSGGMYGASCWRSVSKLIPVKKGWDLTSELPFLPSRSSGPQHNLKIRLDVSGERFASRGILNVFGQLITCLTETKQQNVKPLQKMNKETSLPFNPHDQSRIIINIFRTVHGIPIMN